MPELPEVHAMTERLAPWICENRPVVEKVKVLRSGGSYFVDDGEEKIDGRLLVDVRRRGKYVVFDMLPRGCLVSHNAMSGYWDYGDDPWTFDYVEGARKPSERDVRVVFSLCSKDGSMRRDLRFHDARLFGSLFFYSSAEDDADVPRLSGLGPDALHEWIPEDVLKSGMGSRKNWPVKDMLLTQTIVCGIGNIYACEGLFRAGMDPRNPLYSLKIEDAERLVRGCRDVMEESIAKKLKYGEFLKVYRRKKCPEGHSVERIEISNRGTYFCPTCQK